MFSTNLPTRVVMDPSALRLRIWLLAMVLAPFVPWFTLPIPFIVFVAFGLVSMPYVLVAGSAAILGVALAVLGLLLPITAIMAFVQAKKRDWRSALWYSMLNLGSGTTLLGTFLIATGLGPVEPFGFVSPLAFLTLAALPASFELSRRWLDGRMRDGGVEARRVSRTRLAALSVVFAGLIGGLFAALFAWAGAAVSSLPVGHFYYDEQSIRQSAAEWFSILAMPALLVVFAALRLVIGGGERPSAVPS